MRGLFGRIDYLKHLAQKYLRGTLLHDAMVSELDDAMGYRKPDDGTVTCYGCETRIAINDAWCGDKGALCTECVARTTMLGEG